jgi:hypothetical protein
MRVLRPILRYLVYPAIAVARAYLQGTRLR